MPKYKYLCEVCGKEYLRYKRIQNIDEPEFCRHEMYDNNGGSYPRFYPLTRLFTASFQIIANPEKDKPENQIFNILTRGGGETDKLALMREEEKRMERTYDALKPASARPMNAEDILSTGLMEAAKHPESLGNWRAANISDKTFAEGETIPL